MLSDQTILAWISYIFEEDFILVIFDVGKRVQ